MERVPNAKGHAALPACPLPPIPEHLTESIQREVTHE
jgi:hypothetical protein